MVSSQANRDDFKLSELEIYLYLQANKSNAVSLVTAFEASGDKNFLKIAAEKFPNDPFVQAKILMHDVFPEDRANWINALKLSSPTNSLSFLMAMRDAIDRGDVQQALAELNAARGKTFNDYSAESSQALEEAYLSAGRSELEAKVLGASELTLSHLPRINAMARAISELAEKERQGRRSIAADRIVESELGRGRASSQQKVLLTDLVGIAAQRRALASWPAEIPAEFLDRPIADELRAINEARQEVRGALRNIRKVVPDCPGT